MGGVDDSMDEVVQEFLVESAENLDQLDRDLVSLERDPGSRELLAGIFRTVHTIKGTTGFLGFRRLEALAHKGENLLSKLRDGLLVLDAERTTALLELVDAVRHMLAHIEATGNDEDGSDLTELMDRLVALQEPGASQVATPPAAADDGTSARARAGAPAVPSAAREAPPVTPSSSEEPPGAAATKPASPKPAAAKRRPKAARPGSGAAGAAEVTAPPSVGPIDEPQDSHLSPGPAVPAPRAVADAPQPGTPDRGPGEGTQAQHTGPAAADRSVRVDVELLETLMRQVGELVLARNQLLSHAAELADRGRAMQRLSLIVSELQEDVMRTRMQPVEQLWSKLPRVVRDLAKQFGKEVELALNGGDTELDRSVLEAVKDPLTHLVRNAMDHGIEAPDKRAAMGKPRAGSLSLSASHQGGLVILEMTDDGAGIDPERVGAKALQKELVTEAQLAAMSQREIIDLVFRPGFSTAETVTNVSGRGVGMDVVRTNIEQIGGTVDLLSTPGRGTTVRVKIPLTLAIIPALLVVCRDGRYAIPQSGVQELVRLEGDALHTQVEAVDGALIYRLRGRLLPLLRLDAMLGHTSASLSERSSLDVVVVQADGEPFALAVDSIEGTQEIVVKPLARVLKHLSTYAGATILGDGGVALILDIGGLARAGVVSDGRSAVHQQDDKGASGEGTRSLLVLRVGPDRRVAVPLEQVARLEELDASTVEHAGSHRTVQYRGALLPLVWLGDVIGVPSDAGSNGRLPVVVCGEGSGSVGLVADQILDVVNEVVAVNELGRGTGVLGTTVVQGRATDLLDLPTVAMYAGVAMARTLDLSLAAAPEETEVALDAR
jgi:two-component system chemotaxis sensor kinase CheA